MARAAPVAGRAVSESAGDGPERPDTVAWVLGEPISFEELQLFVRGVQDSELGVRLGLRRALGSNALGSTALGSTALGSTALGSTVLGSTALGRGHGLADGSPQARHALCQWGAKTLARETLLRKIAERRGCHDPAMLLEEMSAELAGDEQPSDAEIRAYYAGSPERFTMEERRWVRQVLCTTLRDAEAVSMEARNGRPMAECATRWSVDEGTKRAGGNLGALRKGELSGPLEDAIFAAAPGEICGPVLSVFGWHVLVVESVEAAHAASLSDVRETIARELLADRGRRACGVWLEGAMRDGIRMAEGYEHPSHRGIPGSVHRH